jgi:hypothetical protein
VSSTHASVRYAVIGGVAKAAWGRPRATRDIDLAVSIDAMAFAALKSALADAGFAVIKMVGGDRNDARPDMFMARASAGVPVDVLVAKTPFEEEAVARSVPVVLFGQTVKVATAEDLVFYKLLAARPRDRDDVLDVIRTRLAGGHSFDWERLERLARDWSVEPAFDDLRQALNTGG